jgi:hypothetical protein
MNKEELKKEMTDEEKNSQFDNNSNKKREPRFSFIFSFCLVFWHYL